jgi:multidrug efflux system outer membrane protein
MSARILLLALSLGSAALLAAGGGAQEPAPDLASALARRPLAELVEALPGRATTLDQLVAVALERNLPLEGARVRRQLAEAGIDVPGGDFDLAFSLSAGLAESRLAPGRGGSYTARLAQVLPWGTVLGLDLTGVRAPATGPAASYDADVGLSLSQPLLEGFRSRDVDLRVARHVGTASAHRLVRALAVLVAEVELAYWDLAEAEAIQAVLARSHEIAGALQLRNEQLAARQLVADVDVITARSGVALRRATAVDARRARADAADAIVFLVWGEAAAEELARDSVPLKTTAVELTVPPIPSPEQAEALALVRRGDLAAARSDLEGAAVVGQGARNARLPSLSLDGAVRSGGTRASLGGSLGALDQAWSWSLGLSFSQPLRNRTDRALDRIAELSQELTRLDLILVENIVRQDVRAAVRAIAAGVERSEAAEEAAALAGAQLEAERRRLDLGLGDSFRLLETEENTVQAELESVRARYDLARAVTRYRLAVGDLEIR